MPNSIVSPLGWSESNCGYCGGKGTLRNYGVWAHLLSCEDYQTLVDRGWRRSGKYLYKPDLKGSCCQQQTIRLDVDRFVLSKSQRKTFAGFRGKLGIHPEKRAACGDKEAVSVEERLREIEEGGKGGRFEMITEASSYSDDKYALYAKYQRVIHKEPERKIDKEGFTRFLVDSPLEPEAMAGAGQDQGYGSFHQRYMVGGRMVALGVVDILPKCVSSVYVMYDPERLELSLGKVTAVVEIAQVMRLSRKMPDLHYYYMGYYIHSCPKMRYKGEYRPSTILDPETYGWMPLADVLPQMEAQRIPTAASPDRLEKEAYPLGTREVTSISPREYGQIHLLRRGGWQYAMEDPTWADEEAREEYAEYCAVLGEDLAKRVFLYVN